MTRKIEPVGTIKTNPNGYKRIKVQLEDGTCTWRFLHHVNWEKVHHRKIGAGERIRFLDGDRGNCKTSNLAITTIGQISPAKEKARLEARIEEMQARLKELEGK